MGRAITPIRAKPDTPANSVARKELRSRFINILSPLSCCFKPFLLNHIIQKPIGTAQLIEKLGTAQLIEKLGTAQLIEKLGTAQLIEKLGTAQLIEKLGEP
jgi:hypothetical protein